MTLLIPFIISLLTQLFCTFGLVAFAPFLILVTQRCSLIFSLWIALGCGLLCDLTSTATPFGIYAIAYTSVTALFFFFRHHLFHERLLALPLSTSLYASLFSAITLLALKLPFNFHTLATSLFIMPLFDAAYAFLGFSLVMGLQRRLARR